MIVSPDATAVEEIVILEAFQRPGSQKVRPMYTEIDRVFLLCNGCEHGVCEIDYWLRDEENATVCSPNSPGCPKCPQWTCPAERG
jgi:hypothetical protein